MDLNAVRAWLIDLDGTLVDTLGDFVAALAEVAQGLGEPPLTAAQVRGLIGRGGETLIRDVLALWGRDEVAFAEAWPAYRAAYARVNGRFAQPFPGLAPGLAALRGDAALRPLACVTNKPQAQADALLARLGLRHAFAAVVGQRPGLRAKPHPDAFLAAAEQLGLPASACGVVGDSRNDAAAARAAGCPVVLLLRHGYNHGEPVDAVPAQAHLDGWPALAAALSDRWTCPAAAT